MDSLNAVLSALAKFAEQLLIIALPILAAAATRWLHEKAQAEIAARKHDTIFGYRIEDAAEFAVNAAEQALAGKDGFSKKAYAIQAAQRWLKQFGVDVDVALIADAVEKAVYTEINRDKKKNTPAYTPTSRAGEGDEGGHG